MKIHTFLLVCLGTSTSDTKYSTELGNLMLTFKVFSPSFVATRNTPSIPAKMKCSYFFAARISKAIDPKKEMKTISFPNRTSENQIF